MLREPVLPMKRRMLLAGAAIGASGIVVGSPAYAQSEDDRTYEWSGSVSANGWPILDSATQFDIEGSGGRTVSLAPGVPATILIHFARRYLYEVADALEPGDVTGHRESRRITADYESNYLSGTAIEVGQLGVAEGLFPPQEAVVERIIKDLGGVITWGRDLDPVKQSHFELNTPPDSNALEGALEKLGGIPDQDESLQMSMTERPEVID